MKKIVFIGFVFCMSLLIKAAPSGTLSGKVTTEQGTPLPGVTIILTSPILSSQTSTTTDRQGSFAFSHLNPGTYSITFSMSGFQTITMKNISLKQNDSKSINITMKTSKLEEAIITDAATHSLEKQIVPPNPTAPAPVGAVRMAYSDAKVRAPYVAPVIPPQYQDSEEYDKTDPNRFKSVSMNPLSTFSIDVDTASYANIRRFINGMGRLPQKDVVRIEEMINYFNYTYENPEGKHPLSAQVEISECPWNTTHRLAKVGIKGKTIEKKNRPAANLVFLLDVSGSMNAHNKLPLVKSAFKMLLKQLNEKDRVAIVVYAGSSGLVLESTPCSEQAKIMNAFEALSAGGSTNAGQGIQLAYNVAREHFIKKGINRVILATDGDFNVGVTNRDDLLELVKKKAESDIFLTVLGFGMGNYKDGMLETLADKGNGNYGYIDTLNEARKVLVEQISGTLVTIAKDVKIQVEFNPLKVEGYRLIGYENRLLNDEDFKDDKKDAGEIGAGHTVTALYELVPAGQSLPGMDELKYQKPVDMEPRGHSNETMTVKIRYKKPEGKKSIPMEVAVIDKNLPFKKTTDDFKFSSAVALFGMQLKDMSFTGDTNFNTVLKLAEEGKGKDSFGYRHEFIQIVKNAEALK